MATFHFDSVIGDDSRTSGEAQSTSTPWKTTTKFNSFFASASPGDLFLFNRGQVFPGALNISRNGSNGSPITVGAYGSGAKPVFTGFYTIPSWTAIGNGLYEAVIPTGLSTANMVTINDTFQPIGRYPKLSAANKGYLTFTSHSGNTSITSQSISAAPNFVGGEVVVRCAHWVLARGPISAQTSTLVTYSKDETTQPANGYGFFFQNHPNACTQFGEWAYNSSTHKLTVYFGASGPGTNVVKVSSIVNLVNADTRSYITFDNLSLSGANNRIISLSTASNIIVQNCDIANSGEDVIWANGGSNNQFLNNNVTRTNNNVITGNNSQSWTITGNTITDTGIVAGMAANRKGSNGDTSSEALSLIGANSLIELNKLYNIGYNGIHFVGANIMIRKNTVSSACMVTDDGGGIYTWSATPTGCRVTFNTVLDTAGAPEGTADGSISAQGIYMDDNSHGVEIDNNTVAGCGYAGIFIHNSANSNIHNNTLFNNGKKPGKPQIAYSNNAATNITGTQYNNNIAFAKDATNQILVDIDPSSNSSAAPLFSSADNNYWCAPFHDTLNGAVLSPFSINDNGTFKHLVLAGWKTETGREGSSHISPIPVTDVNKIRFEYNDNPTSKVVSLGANYVDAKGFSYNGTLTLAPFTSAVLIQTSAITNVLPSANAGADKNITLPTDSVQLSGSGTDTDGTIKSYAWTKLSGPASFSFNSTSSATPTVSSLTAGTYVFQLLVTDNSGGIAIDTVQVIVSAATPANLPPTANAGADKTITAPTTSVGLSGSGVDSDGTISTYAWSNVTGPNIAGFSAASSAATNATGLIPGIYVFKLTVTDDDGATGSDTVQVTVNPAPNVLPIALAGVDKIITLPISTVSITGSGTDADGTITGYEWTKISGPAQYTIVSPATASTAINNLVQGVYIFQLKVTDNSGGTDTDTVQVTVNAAPANILPVSNAGVDKAIQLPVNSVSLTGSGTDADGTIALYTWSWLSGPTTFVISSPNTANTDITGLVAGSYVFQLKVTDNSGGAATDTMKITVSPVNIPPSVSAGVDKNIQLPIATVTLSGSATDSDGTISTYAWTKVSGPGTPVLVNANTAQVTINSLEAGTYIFQLAATDNQGATSVDTTQVIVSPAAANILPTVNAGSNQSITLPTSEVSLVGTATDADGTISTYSWTTLSGPNSPSFNHANQATTDVSSLIAGIYIFKLSATDNSGGVGVSTVTVTVNASTPTNHVPAVYAGADRIISLPLDSVTFAPFGSDPDNNLASYEWSQLSGPTTAPIDNIHVAITTVRQLKEGVYIFQFKATDTGGLFATDTMSITVNKGNVNYPPIANAGIDKTISLPTNIISLTGSGTDSDGTIKSYLWTKLSGPAGTTISTPEGATTQISGLTAGSHVFQLQVTDDGGATAVDSVTVTVTAATTTTIQAETATSKTASTETTIDSGGGQDLYFSRSGRWAKYTINVPASGTYRLDFRTASSTSGAILEFRRGSSTGTILGTVSLPNTGGNQVWATTSKNFVLNSGSHTYTVRSRVSIPFGLNWFSLTRIQ